ncbi:HepT-like ribonuclease domain-containing protein [Aquisalimonas sp. 2447]|uniref:HepT-like ribonuclease domain-containing protein n=1 Tax=Aquisalimonas sp. 2447 TaxID=2740807 RepID=UPI0035300BAC
MCLWRRIVARIPEYRRIIAFRNILVHAYADVGDPNVWCIASSKLPELRRTGAPAGPASGPLRRRYRSSP